MPPIKRFVKHLLGRETTDPWEVYRQEQESTLALMRPFFESSNSENYWAKEENLRRYLTPKRIRFFHRLLTWLQRQHLPHTQSRIIDVGSGSGFLLHKLHLQDPTLLLAMSDLNSGAVELCSAYIPLKETRAENIYALASGVFDLVCCTEVLEHLYQPEEALRNLCSLVQDQSHLLITVPDGRQDQSVAGPPSEDGLFYNGHINFWSPESWRGFIEKQLHGWELKFDVIPDEGYDKNVVLAKRR